MANNIRNVGAFVPTTNVWDVQEVYNVDVTSPEFKELLVRLYQNLNNMSLSLNIRDAGYYVQTEFVNGQLYFADPTLNSLTPQQPIFRQVYRTTINFGALPNAGTKQVPHNIDSPSTPIPAGSAITFTRIYGSSTDPIAQSYIPLPYASTVLANNIELFVDNEFVNVTTAVNYSAYTFTYIVVEYIKS